MTVDQLYLSIYEKADNGEISIYERNTLLLSLFEKELEYVEYIDEGVKERFNKLKKDIGDKIPEDAKKKFNEISDKMNDGMNDIADKAARATVRPADKKLPKGQLYATNSDYDKYYNDVQKWKTVYKTAEIMASSTIAIGPIDTLLKAATFGAMTRSNDPVDKAVMVKIKEVSGLADTLKNKIIALNIQLKKKELTEKQVDVKVREINNNTVNLAKELEALERKKKVVPA